MGPRGWEREVTTVADRSRSTRAGDRRGAVLLVALWVGVAIAGCGQGADRSSAEAVNADPETGTVPEVVATDEDWRIVRQKVEWGRSGGLDTLPVGEAVARLGETFLGTPYAPGTLEVEGPERLVVNLRKLDCVTFVETVLALVHVIRDPAVRTAAAAGGDEGLRAAYRRALTGIRYRGGELDGYPSRLHYFSEWIRDAEEKGIVRDVTPDLGGIPDSEPVSFMTEHPDAYRQLADSAVRDAIRRMEERISRTPRIYVPEEQIDAAAEGIRDGDIIATTSATAGLDVAHTGIALRRDGQVLLLHAPLVGDSVQVSERPLAERVLRIEDQDGILVARPLDPARPGAPGTDDGAAREPARSADEPSE